MGGPMVIYTAARNPERVKAAASFHGASVGTDKTDSPHLLIPETKAAHPPPPPDHDDQHNPEEKTRLKAVLDQIGRASCRERVCQYVSISVVAVSITKTN